MTVHGIHDEQNNRKKFWPLSPELLGRSRRKFYRITLSTHPIPLPSFVQINPVFRDICENVFYDHYNIGVKPGKGASYNSGVIENVFFLGDSNLLLLVCDTKVCQSLTARSAQSEDHIHMFALLLFFTRATLC